MPSQIMNPTLAFALGAWSDGANALGWNTDGNGAKNQGAGYLSLRGMTGRENVSNADAITGFEITMRARSLIAVFANDTFTDTAETRLDQHDGEVGADWQRPTTGAEPSYQRISASGRAYHGFENSTGSVATSAEHFLTNLVTGTADYSVEARIYSASDGGSNEYAEIYARATTPYTFYVLQYDEAGNIWRLGVWDSPARSVGQMTEIGTYSGDAIPVGGSKLARLEVIGTAIKAYIEGVERIAGTDTTITAAGYPGIRLDAGTDHKDGRVTVSAMLDLGSAQTVTKASKRIGNLSFENGGRFSLFASNDGITWVDAEGAGSGTVPFPSATFRWLSCEDTTNITATPYRYWRVHVTCGGSATNPAEPRIGDFRLEVGGSPATYAAERFALSGGITPHIWSEGTATTAFTDAGACDNTTWVGGTVTAPNANQGLQFESFRVTGIGNGAVNVALSADGVTPRGITKTLTLGTTYTEQTVGGSTDLWNGSWSVEEIRKSTFSALLSETISSSSVEVDALRVIIYHVGNGGSFRTMREQVRQQILIGRETGTNEVQTLTVTGTPTGGTFRITLDGVETANIAYNATPANVQTALEAISSVGAGNVTCGGGTLPGATVTITFTGSKAATPQNLCTVTNAAFTGGTTPTGAIARTTNAVREIGAGATANVRLRHARIQPNPTPDYLDHRPAGEKLTNHQIVIKEATEGTIEGIPTYDELGYLLAGAIARPNTSTLQTSVAFRHVFAMDNRLRDSIATYQAEYGDQQVRAHRIKGMVVNAIDLALRQDGIDLGGAIFGKILEDGIAMNPGAATVQTMTMSGTGTFRLRWKGQETADINAATATSSDIQTALRALPGINASTALTVTGASSPFTITFANTAGQPFTGFPQPLLEIRTITGSPVVSMAMTTRGGYTEHAGVVVEPRHVEVFLTPTLANLGSSKLVNAFSTGFTIGNRRNPVYNLDRSETSWYAAAETATPEVGFSLMAEANAPIMQFLSQARTDTIMFLRILATGSLIGASAFPHRLQIDCPVKISNFGPFGESQELYAFEYEFVGQQDNATNTNLVVTLDNGVASY